MIGLTFLFAGIGDGFSPATFIGIVIIASTIGCAFGVSSDSVVEKQTAEWQDHVAKPYILSLPEEKYELVDATLIPKGIYGIELSSSLHSKDAQAMSISYLNESGTFIKNIDWMEINMALSESDKPYVTAHVLPESLGNDIESGTYFLVVHVSKNYEF